MALVDKKVKDENLTAFKAGKEDIYILQAQQILKVILVQVFLKILQMVRQGMPLVIRIYGKRWCR